MPTSRPMPTLAGVTHRYVDLPGLRMHVAEAGPPEDAEPVLLLHGFPQHWWAWREVIPALAEHHRVICPDLRGAGWTEAPRRGYRRTQLLADVVALLDVLGVERVRVVAHDWSAILAFQLCLAHPDRVRSYVCVGTPHPYLRPDLRLLKVMPHLWFQQVITAPLLGRWLLGRPSQRFTRYLMLHYSAAPDAWSAEDLEHFTAPFREPGRARAGVALYRGFIMREAVRILLGRYRSQRLRTPTLVLYGAEDRAMPVELLGGYEQHADDLVLELVGRAAHFLVDDRPDVVVDRSLGHFAAH